MFRANCNGPDDHVLRFTFHAATMTIQEALRYGRSQLRHTSPTPELDARLLLQFVLGQPHTYLIAHGERPLTPPQSQQYQALLRRAQQSEPIPYIIGEAPFYGLTFRVTPDVLIPRPETEQLVEMVLDWAGERGALQFVDVGTGSGCIAVTLAHHLPQASVTAVDLSTAALAVAQENARRLTGQSITFLEGSLLSPVAHKVDLIVANLPYITDGEWTMLDDGVKLHEPALALRGGVDGLMYIGSLLQQAGERLNPGGAVFLEIGWRQGTAVTQLATTIFPAATVTLTADFAGHDRMVTIQT
jgi:release factor glutamine methyltransferase